MHRRLVLFALFALSLVGSLFPWSQTVEAAQPVAPMQQEQRCFPETGQCISGRFRSYWEQNGGLAVFGFPITAAVNETTAEGTFLTQYFERNRFELHPEKAAPYDVLLGRLGDLRLQQQGRNWFTFPKGQQTGGCLWFAETGHSICEPFKSYWEGHGLQDPALAKAARSLALIGLPLSEPMMETNASGDTVLTQWFERARFEFHPNNTPEYQVLLGLLGNETRAAGATPQPTPAPAQPTPAPTPPPTTPNQCSDVPQPVSARIRPSNCVKQGTVTVLDVFGFKANEQVGFWLTAPDGSRVGTAETVNIGPTGGVNGLGFDTSDLDPGLWFWVFQGTSSNHQSIIYFKVLPR